MTDQLTSFETAKLAKEKGFNIRCSMIHISCPEYPNWHDKIGTYETMPYLANGCDVTNIPTQSLLQKWLREVHNIDIIIKPWTGDIKGMKTYATDITIFGSNKYIKGSRYNTYEEALEAGLLNALNLIP